MAKVEGSRPQLPDNVILEQAPIKASDSMVCNLENSTLRNFAFQARELIDSHIGMGPLESDASQDVLRNWGRGFGVQQTSAREEHSANREHVARTIATRLKLDECASPTIHLQVDAGGNAIRDINGVNYVSGQFKFDEKDQYFTSFQIPLSDDPSHMIKIGGDLYSAFQMDVAIDRADATVHPQEPIASKLVESMGSDSPEVRAKTHLELAANAKTEEMKHWQIEGAVDTLAFFADGNNLTGESRQLISQALDRGLNIIETNPGYPRAYSLLSNLNSLSQILGSGGIPQGTLTAQAERVVEGQLGKIEELAREGFVERRAAAIQNPEWDTLKTYMRAEDYLHEARSLVQQFGLSSYNETLDRAQKLINPKSVSEFEPVNRQDA